MDKNILLIDKEKRWTSFDVVARIRKITGEKRVGHTGTLDPFATGLLIVLVGKEATKRQIELMKMDKEYIAVLELGKTSTTGDPEGKIIKSKIKKKEPKITEIKLVLSNFLGEIDQIPPAYSAIKIEGKKAYELARKGIEPKLKPRKVVIHSIEVLDYRWPFLRIKVRCGSGTYIRSLASDIGKALGVGAYLRDLRRTKIGKFDVKEAKKISQIS